MSVVRIEKEGQNIRLIYPVLFTLILMVFFHLPSPLMVLSKLAPMTPVIFTYYWSVQRPSVASLISVFIIALFHDIWSENVVGITPLLVILVRLAIVPNQEVFRVAPFSLRWLAFSIVLLGLMLVKWFLISGIYLAWISYRDLVFQSIISVALYPLFNHFYAMIDRRMIMRS